MKKAWILISLGILFALQATAQVNYTLPRLSPKAKDIPGVSTPVISLDGKWNFQTQSISSCPIEVPGEWTMQGFQVPEGEAAFYSRKFTLPGDWQGQRVFLKFDGVSSYGLVKVNGKQVGEHEGGMVPFACDVTDVVKTGENNVEVEVRAWTISDRMGCISQYACHTVGGLVRKVTLYALPKVNVASMDVTTTLDKSYKQATLHIATEIANEANLPGNITLQYQLKDHAGKSVFTHKETIGQAGKINSRIPVKNAKLWNSEQPYLYTLATTLSVDGKVLQTNEQRVGLRQIEIKGNVLYINGKAVKLRGVNRHEAHPLRGRSLTPELCRQDAELFKAGNCNYIRTSHYPPSEEFLEICDEIGLYVESEAALNWIQHGSSPIWRKWDYQDRQYLPYMVRANIDNVLAGRKHPSVIIWSIANESRWSPLWDEVKQVVADLDPSRPNSFHDQCWGGFNNANSTADIANYHYPGINGPAACDTMSRPTLFGEYAHLTCYNSRELLTDPGVRAAYGEFLVQMYDSMYYHPACLGGAIWSGIDDIFHLPDGQITGYGPWGPIDAWRRPKPEYTGMKKAYTPFRILATTLTDKNLELQVENRYNFIDFGQVTIEAGTQNGSMTPVKSKIAARASGKISIPLAVASGNELYLRVTDPEGRVCHEELFTIKENTPLVATATTTVNTKEEGDNLYILYDGYTVIFNKITGMMSQAYKGNKVLMNRGPIFNLIPMNSDDGGKLSLAGETYQNNIYPLKNYPNLTMYANSVTYKKDATGNVLVDVEVAYRNGDIVKLSYKFGTDKRVTVDYALTVAAQELRPRQYGLLLQLPKTMDQLSWTRKGEFSVYPEYDIARTTGKATLNARELYEVEEWGVEPKGAWKEDGNYLGSVDFRSTKTQILQASLTDSSGNGLTVYGDGKQAFRSWLQDESIHVLIAEYSNTGSERFYGTPFTSGRITVKKGDVLSGKINFEFK